MQNPCPVPIRLTRVDPALNMARFYEASVQPTLFGEVALMRRWGRIGARGQQRMVTWADEQQALSALDRLEQQKRRRGYGTPAEGDSRKS